MINKVKKAVLIVALIITLYFLTYLLFEFVVWNMFFHGRILDYLGDDVDAFSTGVFSGFFASFIYAMYLIVVLVCISSFRGISKICKFTISVLPACTFVLALYMNSVVTDIIKVIDYSIKAIKLLV